MIITIEYNYKREPVCCPNTVPPVFIRNQFIRNQAGFFSKNWKQIKQPLRLDDEKEIVSMYKYHTGGVIKKFQYAFSASSFGHGAIP